MSKTKRAVVSAARRSEAEAMRTKSSAQKWSFASNETVRQESSSDEALEAMLLEQTYAGHEVTMKLHKCAMAANADDPAFEKHVRLSTKMMALLPFQIEALNRLRARAPQDENYAEVFTLVLPDNGR